jgi:hypothetical protein
LYAVEYIFLGRDGDNPLFVERGASLGIVVGEAYLDALYLSIEKGAI